MAAVDNAAEAFYTQSMREQLNQWAITLRALDDADLPIFFAHQRDREAAYMAAFTAKDPDDWPAFLAHWAKVRSDPTIITRTILVGEQVAGSVSVHSWFGEPEITYWIGREFWGAGVATAALRLFLAEVATRPLHGRAAADNRASIRVLEKCGFVKIGDDRGFANARGEEIDEVVYRLDG